MTEVLIYYTAVVTTLCFIALVVISHRERP